jgi:FtsH-binding integral membrane protein
MRVQGMERIMRALSLVPVAYVVLGLVYVGAGGPTTWPFAVIARVCMLVCVAAVVGSVVHIARNRELNENDRTTWLVLALAMGFITLPVYWFSVAPRAQQRAHAASA